MDAPDRASSTGVLSVGEVVSDRYRVDAVLGEGGMGIVYRVEHLHLRKAHALKVLLPEWSSMPEVVARFEREAVAAGNIQSPHVAAATDFGRMPNGSFFLVMEYVNGRTLRSVLDAGALEPARALHVLEGIVSGLGAAHAGGIVHRDLKPENVMLIERDGDPDFVKVLDFGIAKLVGLEGVDTAAKAQPLTKVGAVIGTPDYMSPEQALGQHVDERSDLYSVGVILFEMLTGRCPFQGGAVTLLRQHVMASAPELPSAGAGSMDPSIGAIVRRLLAKLPEDRFASAAELLSAIDGYVNERKHREARAARPSLESLRGMTTPVARRIRESLLAGVQAVTGAARRTLADPGAFVRAATRRQLTIAVALLAVTTTVVALVAGAGSRAPVSTAAPPSTDSASQVFPSTSPAASTQATGSAVPLSILPPPPVPSSSRASASTPSGQPASSQGPSRRTGPGGIYIPPPSQWFN